MPKRLDPVNPNDIGNVALPEHLRFSSSSLTFQNAARVVLSRHWDRLKTLSPYEQRSVVQVMAYAIVNGDSKLDNNLAYEALWLADYRVKPVSIEQFLEDDFYLGRSCGNLEPIWKRDLKEVLRFGSPYLVWVLSGAIGVGKTTVSMAGIAYKTYLLSCLKDPWSYYGILADAPIVFGCYSITKSQAADTGYTLLKSYIDNSPYFNSQFPRSPKIESVIDFYPLTGRRIRIISGSRALHAIGQNLYSVSMDEVNFMQSKQDKETRQQVGQAYELFNEVRSRIISRFMRPGGNYPGLLLLMSSKNSQTSFLEGIIAKKDPQTYVSDYAQWLCKPSYKYTLPKFRVEIGDRYASSRILEAGEASREGAEVIEVPGEYRKNFVENIDKALREIAGRATFNVSPLITDRQSLYDAYRQSMVHPFTKESVTIGTNNRMDFIESWFQPRMVANVVGSLYVPRFNAGTPRVIHVDLALTGDCAGISMGHISGYKRLAKVQPDGTESMATEPFIYFDFMLRVTPPSTGQIDMSKIRAFIGYIRKIYPVVAVTFDGYQSADSVQILSKMGIVAAVQSVDRTDNPYVSLRAALSERRVAMYRYAPCERELLDLQYDIVTGKVDHPAVGSDGLPGSKDVTDSMAGVVHRLLNDPQARPEAAGITAQVFAASSGVAGAGTRQVDPDVELPSRPSVSLGGRTVDWSAIRRAREAANK